MYQRERPPQFEWPLIQWRTALTWYIPATALTFLTFIFPNLVGASVSWQMRVGIGAAILGLPLALSMIQWLLRSVCVVYGRTQHYSRLYKLDIETSRMLAEAREMLVTLVQAQEQRLKFEMQTVFLDKERLYLTLVKKRTPKVGIGDRFVVIDADDRMEMGIFQIHSIRQREYIAIEVSGVSSLWRAYVREKGPSVPPSPSLMALFYEQGKINDEQSA